MSSIRPSQSTRPIVYATLIGIVAVFAFQALGTRTLGPEGYAPISQLWTVYFLGFTMFLLPIEQIVAHQMVMQNGSLDVVRHLRWPIAMTVLTSMAATGVFVGATLDLNFNGQLFYLPASVALAGTYVLFALTRGIAAGQLRLRDYANAVAAESVTRLVVAAILLSFRPTASSLVIAMLVAPFAALVGRPFSGEKVLVETPSATAGEQLAGLVVGTVAAQVILASGPIVVAFLDGTAAQVSIVFVTFVLLRGPLTSSYNFLSRILHWIAVELTEERTQQVVRRVRTGIGVGVGASLISGTAAYLLGPAIVAGVYGGEFRPSRMMVAIGAVGVVLATTALFASLVLVAVERTGVIAVGWIVALVVMVAAILSLRGDPGMRFALGFLAGEIAALTVLGEWSLRTIRTGR